MMPFYIHLQKIKANFGPDLFQWKEIQNWLRFGGGCSLAITLDNLNVLKSGRHLVRLDPSVVLVAF